MPYKLIFVNHKDALLH